MLIPHEVMIGQIRCVVVSDGNEPISHQDLSEMFPPDSGIQPVLAELTYPQDFLYNCLLIQTGGETILIDAGQGVLDPNRPPVLQQSLQAAGVQPDQVTMVVLTHGHGDHIGGLVEDDGQLNFPNARYLMTRRDWEHWTGPAMRPISQRRLIPVKDRIELIEPNTVLAAGVRTVDAWGHTPGHIAIEVESEGQKLLDMVDAIHHPFQLKNPAWSMGFDFDSVQSATVRRQLLQQAADEQCWVMAYHFPYPGVGKVSAEGDGFVWTSR